MVRTPHETASLGPLRFLYVGSADFDADFRYYRDSLGAELVWNRKAFGARVAAFHVGTGPLLLLADHRPAPSCLPIFEVDDFEKALKDLKRRGNTPDRARSRFPMAPAPSSRIPAGTSSQYSRTSGRTCSAKDSTLGILPLLNSEGASPFGKWLFFGTCKFKLPRSGISLP
jgi:hypothetical protein